MSRKTIFGALVVALLAITIFNILTVGESSSDYITRVENERKTKNGYMMSSSSPLPKEERRAFTGLKFFQIDESYKVKARITPVARKQPIFIPTTTGESKKYIPYGYAEFELQGQPQKVILYQDWDENNPTLASLMFADNTSGNTTYGGGRYLDVPLDGTRTVTLDFNLAYNPFCHFNDEWSCPIPPRENLMEIDIEAGERLYKEL